MNSIPVLIDATSSFRLSIDTSNGSRYSDYTFNSFDNYYFFQPYNFRRTNSAMNWRYYFRVYFENELGSSTQFSQNISKIKIGESKITAWLNLTNGTSLNSTCLVKRQLQTTTKSDLTSLNNELVTSTKTISTQSLISNLTLMDNISSSFSTISIRTQTETDSLMMNKTHIVMNSTIESKLLLNYSRQLILSEILNGLFSTSHFNQINITEIYLALENKTFQCDLKLGSSFPTQLLESSNFDIYIDNTSLFLECIKTSKKARMSLCNYALLY